MRPYDDFGEALSTLLRKKKCSATELARKLGYKSHTSIVRILHHKVSHDIQEAFFHKLILTNALLLSTDEKLMLQQCLDNGRFTPEARQAHERLWRFLFSEQEGTLSRSLSVYSEGNPPRMCDQDQWASGFADAETIEIILFGCCNESFFSFLSVALLPYEEKCFLRHYCDLGAHQNDAVKAMICAAIMLRFQHYEAFCLHEQTQANHSFLSREDRAYISWSDASGAKHMQLIHVSNGEHDLSYEMADGDQYWALLEELIVRHGGSYVPMRCEYVHPGMAENFLLLSQRLLFLEKDRAQRVYRPAPCYNHIATEILTPDMLSVLGLPESHPVIEQLKEVHTERHVNAFGMRSLTELVFLENGMWEFIRTGYLPDHIEALPPISVEGRIEVLQDLLNAAENNPFFHFYLLPEDIRIRQLMLSSHEGLGVYLLDPVFTFQQTRSYFEEILPAPAFIEAFNSFFDNVLIKEHAYSRKESCKKLDEMIRWIKGNTSAL